jgi:hypothetical protein
MWAEHRYDSAVRCMGGADSAGQRCGWCCGYELPGGKGGSIRVLLGLTSLSARKYLPISHEHLPYLHLDP